ncbi:Heme oxygenase (biliverdin-producing) protein [Dioscorea alata]|uniref:Heme oxygenase (Biliverdin-producing) protein n=1 Tax=Dioscorea alata TaxID=55571 RepID=A0ACB7U2R7_DIOAL|nr:Heme oxygenase (biliverdin-producing) protein [Dioscorea alata]
MLSFRGASPAPLVYSSSLLPFPPLKILNPNPSSNLLSPNCIPFSGAISAAPPPASTVLSKRKRYRKMCPGEAEGIAQEMRFVAMRLRNSHSSTDDDGGDLWQPSMDGFLKYLVDSKLVFDTVERIVDESADVSYAYFRKTGLERSSGLSKDLEWFSQQGPVIPEQSSPGITYAHYLEELAEKSGPSFLCHFYNIYFAHIAGGQVIGKQACEKLSVGKELEFHKWQGDVQELLKDAREKLNKLGEHWTRYEKNRCLREAAKSFKFSGQIVRLIIL